MCPKDLGEGYINTLSDNGKLSFYAPDLAILLAEHTLSIFTRFDYANAKLDSTALEYFVRRKTGKNIYPPHQPLPGDAHS
jgi:hypothetical protein